MKIDLTCLLILFLGMGNAHAQQEIKQEDNHNKIMIVKAYDSLTFIPFNSSNPRSPQYAVLSGDPFSGPSSILLKFKKGPGLLHYHSSDYFAIVVEGELKHWEKGQTEDDVKSFGPGSYWSQPGGLGHGDSCLSKQCIVFVNWSGKMDASLVE